MALRFMQANLNHSARAQDLMIQSMAEWLINITAVSEPYFIPPRPNWTGDHDGLVAIICQGVAFDKVIKGRGYVAALVGGVMVIATYFSPNRVLAEFESFLVDVGTLVGQNHLHPVLVLGDFNAKSAAWGCPITDARGDALEEWALTTGLLILNQGSVQTCVRQHGGSIVDVSFASPNLVRRVNGWEVMAEVETLSDHRYIRFEVSSMPLPPSRLDRPNVSRDSPRWALKRLNPDLLEEAAIVQAWLSTPSTPAETDVQGEATWFQEAMTHICDVSMPRVGAQPPKRRVYWWSAELADLREDCVAARREYTRYRRRRRRDEVQEGLLYNTYREHKDALKLAIAQAKGAARDELLESINRDPWGRPYRMVRCKLRPWAPPLTESLEPRLVETVVAALFPTREEHTPPPMVPSAEDIATDDDDVPEVDEVEMKESIRRLGAKNTAPGPDGIPGRAWVLALKALCPRLRDLYSACLKQGRFPAQWKTGRLVLLKKDGRPADSPSAYRPIVLLDEVGKLLERIIAGRLIGHLNSVGPNLDNNQFGFRRGRSTVGAVLRVKSVAEEAVARGEVVLAVSLDIANAFNTLPWSCIRQALKYHQVPCYLCQTIEDYFDERFIAYQDQGGWRQHKMSCGVPQGSVLGPLLWNIGYDWVLRGATLWGVSVTCYADDTLVLARGKSYRQAALLATAGVAQTVDRIKRLGLEVALNKSEALCFHGPRNKPPAGSHIVVGGVRIAVESTMKYLGLVLDSRWDFNEHFRRLAPKLMGTAAALGGLLPNLRGAGVSCRKLYMGVVRSMAMYGAPVWAVTLSSRNIATLRKPQRAMALRVIRGYRTVSCEAACVLAGSTPWDLEAKSLSDIYFWREEELARGQRPALREIEGRRQQYRDALEEEWLGRLARPSAGLTTIEAVRPVFKEWLSREHGSLSFRLTQVLSGHGCFSRYLCRIGREPTTACHHCACGNDTVQHTLADCPSWAEPRRELTNVIGSGLSLPALLKAMVESEDGWRAGQTFCEEVLSQKEAAERERETLSLNPIRSRRAGRRRRTLHFRPP